MNASETICPVCKNKNELEAVVCRHCGAALHDPFLDPGAKTNDMPVLVPERIRNWSFNEAAVPEGGIAVYVEGEFNPAYITSGREVVIGRKGETASDISFDLAPLGGYHLGLSRRHALIRRTEHACEVVDLGSVNGTWLNDERLVPHKAYPLSRGSHLRLGQMRLFVLYRPLAETQTNV
jgi:hypothetical protein